MPFVSLPAFLLMRMASSSDTTSTTGHQRNGKIERIAEIWVKVLVVRERLDVVLQAQPVRLAEQVVIGEG